MRYKEQTNKDLKSANQKMIVFDFTIAEVRGFPHGQHLVNAGRPDSRHLDTT